MNRLIISPHSDDAALSCFHALNGMTVVVVPFSQSCWGYNTLGPDVTSIRITEDETALLNYIGVRKLIHLGLPDTSIRTVEGVGEYGKEKERLSQLRQHLTLLSEEMFDEIYLPMGCGNHIDHIACREVGLSVFKGQGKIFLCGEQPYLVNGHNLPFDTAKCQYISISPKEKARILKCYTSQLDRKTIKIVVKEKEVLWEVI